MQGPSWIILRKPYTRRIHAGLYCTASNGVTISRGVENSQVPLTRSKIYNANAEGAHGSPYVCSIFVMC
jgi:hypothetical protein